MTDYRSDRQPEPYAQVLRHLGQQQYHWLVTGVAGFIGSSLLEALLSLGQKVRGLDNFSTGFQHNLDLVRERVGEQAWRNFDFVRGDIQVLADCTRVCKDVDFVLHQAALGSVPRSISDPITTNANNVTGFLNMLVACRDGEVKRFIYAASSSTYGDHPGLPKVEAVIGKPLSPYAVTKYVNELYADVFGRCYGVASIGLRYFNVFGPRQNKAGAYASVIPLWINALIHNEPVYINGDGSTSRDFCHVQNVIQANLLAALCSAPQAINEVYNIAVNERTSLNELYHMMRAELGNTLAHVRRHRPTYRDFRAGDVRHSQADITKAKTLLGFEPSHRIEEGLKQTIAWYQDRQLVPC